MSLTAKEVEAVHAGIESMAAAFSETAAQLRQMKARITIHSTEDDIKALATEMAGFVTKMVAKIQTIEF